MGKIGSRLSEVVNPSWRWLSKLNTFLSFNTKFSKASVESANNGWERWLLDNFSRDPTLMSSVKKILEKNLVESCPWFLSYDGELGYLCVCRLVNFEKLTNVEEQAWNWYIHITSSWSLKPVFLGWIWIVLKWAIPSSWCLLVWLGGSTFDGLAGGKHVRDCRSVMSGLPDIQQVSIH